MTIAAITNHDWKELRVGVIWILGNRVPDQSATDWSSTIKTPKAIIRKVKKTVNLLGGVHAILNHIVFKK